jgi:predicted membrane channel-forming protein YqfA (hemolysin III family)
MPLPAVALPLLTHEEMAARGHATEAGIQRHYRACEALSIGECVRASLVVRHHGGNANGRSTPGQRVARGSKSPARGTHGTSGCVEEVVVEGGAPRTFLGFSWDAHRLHNETLNVLTAIIPLLIACVELVAAFVFLILGTGVEDVMVAFSGSRADSPRAETLTQLPSFFFAPRVTSRHVSDLIDANHAVVGLVFVVYAATVAVGFLSSLLYHACKCHASPRSRQKTATFDYMGIIILGSGSCVPGIVFGFWCFPALFRSYALYGVVNCAIGLALTQWERFQKENGLRIQLVAMISMIGVVFAVHLASILPDSESEHLIEAISGYYMLLGTGLAFFVSKFPERHFHGRFDIFGHSHQIWHVLVATGVFWLYSGWLHYLHHKISSGGISCNT